MTVPDDIARMNREMWNREVEKGAHYTVPWLNLDPEAVRRYAECGDDDPWMGRFVWPAHILTGVHGKDVLCLASGGGQQSAVFGLLGARVTVLDLTEGQLEGDRRAAQHYGFPVTTLQGDMRDLSALADESFDLVYQSISLAFVPDVRPVYRGVARVLRTGGLYVVWHCNPTTIATHFDGGGNGWDGVGYRIAQRYGAGPVRRRADGVESFGEGEPTGEFVHYLSDIFNGLAETGLGIRGVYEDPRTMSGRVEGEPGSDEHRDSTVMSYFGIVAAKG